MVYLPGNPNYMLRSAIRSGKELSAELDAQIAKMPDYPYAGDYDRNGHAFMAEHSDPITDDLISAMHQTAVGTTDVRDALLLYEPVEGARLIDDLRSRPWYFADRAAEARGIKEAGGTPAGNVYFWGGSMRGILESVKHRVDSGVALLETRLAKTPPDTERPFAPMTLTVEHHGPEGSTSTTTSYS